MTLEHIEPASDDPMRHEQATIVRPVGELDLATAPALDDAIRRHAGTGLLVIDLEHVTFIDSSGLHVLVDHCVRAPRREGETVVMGACGDVLATLRVSGLDVVLPMAPDAEAVLAGRPAEVVRVELDT